MNTGAITQRYARALLRLTAQTGRGEAVCTQVRAMLRDSSSIPERLEPDLENFIALLSRHGRAEYLRRIFRSYVDMYCESVGLKYVMLTTAVPSAELEERVRTELESRFGARVLMETRVDPALIGGYRVEVDGRMMDATVRRQFVVLQRKFVETVTRIV